MEAILERDLSAPSQHRAIRDLLQSIFAMELLQPSNELWFLSAWVSDIEVLDNQARAFGDLVPDWPSAPIRLSRVLSEIASRGARLRIVTRDLSSNNHFLSALRPSSQLTANRLKIWKAPDFHEKGIVGTDYVLDGSMNFTQNGITVNDEHLIYRASPAAAAERRLTLNRRWLGGQST
ncbi:phospholipase D-like domain-containing protein DpdK [Myxococcota bacterium]